VAARRCHRDHVKERRQFGRPLADFELVQDKVGWMVSYLFGLESLAYLTTGLVDRGVPDYSLESAICKVAGTEFLWYQSNRALQLKGGAGYMRDEPYEKVLRDTRIFPIFEGANDVLRAFIALTGMRPLGDELSGLGDVRLGDPIGSLGVLADYVGGRIQRAVRPDRITKAHRRLSPLASSLSDQVGRLRSVTESLLRAHRQDRRTPVPPEAFGERRLRHLRAGCSPLAGHGPSRRARRRAVRSGALHRRDLLSTGRGSGERVLDQIERNDDERMVAIAKLAYSRGEYGYAFFED
jgi:acyl-CoA dehydrogenase family member 9